MPSRPTHFHCVPGASTLNDIEALAFPARPTTNSAIIIGMPIRRMQTRYTRMKTAPPPSAVELGKRQILPRPTADPAAAATIPSFEPNETRLREC